MKVVKTIVEQKTYKMANSVGIFEFTEQDDVSVDEIFSTLAYAFVLEKKDRRLYYPNLGPDVIRRLL